MSDFLMNDGKGRVRTPMTRHRRARISDMMRQHGVVRVDELADHFGVSQVTIRNDLVQLEQEGHLIRDRGGAIPSAPTTNEGALNSLLAMEQRTVLRGEEKARIGRAAAQMVEAGDIIIIDAGTTTVEMTRHLVGLSSFTVVTNALNVAVEVSKAEGAQLIFLGGTLNREAASMLGPLTERALADLVVGKLFLGTQAFNLEDGLTDTTMEIAQVKRAMIAAARQVVLLTDSSKWDRAGFIKVAPLSSVNKVISDTDLSEEARSAIEKAGVELELV